MDRWRQRMETLRVYRDCAFAWAYTFRRTQIDAYYTKTLLPEYARAQGVKAPKLDDAISQRIQEVLLQEQVSEPAGGLAEVAARAGQRAAS